MQCVCRAFYKIMYYVQALSSIVKNKSVCIEWTGLCKFVVVGIFFIQLSFCVKPSISNNSLKVERTVGW